MDTLCLNNPDEFPDDAVLNRHLNTSKKAWEAFMALLDEQFSEFSREWRYYKDGKSWLYKITKKKKTICWVGVFEQYFKTTFYFPERAEALIRESPLDQKYIDQFIEGKKYGKIKGLTVEIREPSDLEHTKKMIAIKEQFK